MKTIFIPPRDPKTGKGGQIKEGRKTFLPGEYIVGRRITPSEAEHFVRMGWATSEDADAPDRLAQAETVEIQPDNIVQTQAVKNG